MASNTLILGLQWGDEGKGKIVDALSEEVSQEGFFRIGLFLLLSLMFFTTFNDLRDLGLF